MILVNVMMMRMLAMLNVIGMMRIIIMIMNLLRILETTTLYVVFLHTKFRFQGCLCHLLVWLVIYFDRCFRGHP